MALSCGMYTRSPGISHVLKMYGDVSRDASKRVKRPRVTDPLLRVNVPTTRSSPSISYEPSAYPNDRQRRLSAMVASVRSQPAHTEHAGESACAKMTAA